MPKAKAKKAKSKTTSPKSSATNSKKNNNHQQTSKSFSHLLKRSHKKQSKKDGPKLMGAFKILGRSILNLTDHWPQFLTILLIYVLLNLVFVSGFTNLAGGAGLQADVNGIFHGSTSHLAAGSSFFESLLSSSANSGSDLSSTYQIILDVIFSLVVIWCLRVVLSAKKQLRVSDGFYKGLYPLIPAVLIGLLITVELIPMLIGSYIYGVVMGNGLSANFLQDGLWLTVLFVLTALSMYFVTSSIFAFYIVTLPDMRPMVALRSARKLVKHRRLLIFRKIIFLPICLLIIGFVILIPFAEILPGETYWLYLILISLALFIAHSYMYTLYRELL